VKLATAAVTASPTKVWAPRSAGLYAKGPFAIALPRQDGSIAADADGAAKRKALTTATTSAGVRVLMTVRVSKTAAEIAALLVAPQNWRRTVELV
jgi:hypothetical protein